MLIEMGNHGLTIDFGNLDWLNVNRSLGRCDLTRYDSVGLEHLVVVAVEYRACIGIDLLEVCWLLVH
jgi:hypothetical protein